MAPRYLLSTASLYFSSLAQTLLLVREVGFDGLELSLTPASAWVRPDRLQALAQQEGLLLASVHPPTIPLPGWGHSPPDFGRLAHLARALPDCQIVVLHVPDAYREDEARVVRFYRTLEVLQEALAGSPVTVALENRNRRPGERLGILDDPEALLEFSRRWECGIVLDTAHASTLPLPLLEVCRAVRERLVNVHLSDVAPGGWWDRFSYLRSIITHHRPPGQGVLPLRALLEELGRSGYDGLITLELSPLALRVWSRPATRRILQQALRDCRRWIGDKC